MVFAINENQIEIDCQLDVCCVVSLLIYSWLGGNVWISSICMHFKKLVQTTAYNISKSAHFLTDMYKWFVGIVWIWCNRTLSTEHYLKLCCKEYFSKNMTGPMYGSCIVMCIFPSFMTEPATQMYALYHLFQ